MDPDHLVFDAEPLVAHALDERGATTVSTYLDAVGLEDVAGYVNWVNVCEVRYIVARLTDRSVADEYIEWLFELGLKPVDTESVWMSAADHVLAYNPALGDSFALATAASVDGTLLVGGDDDYNEVVDIEIERFRDGPA